MKVTTRPAAMRMVTESLFRPGGTLAGRDIIRFDGGKYRSNMVGRDIPSTAPPDGPVWCEKRMDSDGPYWALFCFRRD